MATVTLLGSTFNTTSGTHTVTATPAVGDYIVIVFANTGVTGDVSPTDDNNSGTYSNVRIASKATNADRMGMAVRNSPITSAVSTIFTQAPGTTTGGGIAVYKISGMTLSGQAATRSGGTQSNGTAAATPTIAMSAGAVLTGNPVIGAVFNATSPGTLTPKTGYTEDYDVGYSTPTAGIEGMHINSGETASSVAWGSTSSTAFCAVVNEFQPTYTTPVVQAVSKSATASPVSASPFGTAVAVNDLIVVTCGTDVGTTGLVTAVNDSLGNTYTAIPGYETVDATNNIGLTCWYAPVTVAGSGNVITVTFNAASTNINVVAQHYNGFTGTPTLDQMVTALNASSTNISSGSTATTTQSTEVVVGSAVHAGAVAPYVPLGGTGYASSTMTDSVVANREVAMMAKTISATGTQSASYLIQPARAAIVGVATFYSGTAPTTNTTNFFAMF